MKMAPVKSSNVEEVGYDPEARILAVKFKSGGVYHYSDVPPNLFEEMNKADSIGSFIARRVRVEFAGERQEEKDGE